MKNRELKNETERLAYWMWGADEPAICTCNFGHKNCAVEKDGVCMDWLQIQVDKESPMREKTEAIPFEDLFKEGGDDLCEDLF